MDELPDIRSLHDHGPYSGYCMVCWFPVYTLWADDKQHGNECINGCKDATNCSESRNRAETAAALRKYKSLHGTLK